MAFHQRSSSNCNLKYLILFFFSVLFDESLNHVLDKSQMDIPIHFWSENMNRALTCYWDPQFHLNTDADT